MLMYHDIRVTPEERDGCEVGSGGCVWCAECVGVHYLEWITGCARCGQWRND